MPTCTRPTITPGRRLAHLVVDERAPHRHRPLGEVDDARALVDDDQAEGQRRIHGAEAEPDDEEQEWTLIAGVPAQPSSEM